MKSILVYGFVLVSFIFSTNISFGQQTPKDIASQLDKNRITLFNGWSLTPVGKSLSLEDMPLNIAVSPSGKYVAITNNGDGKQAITLIGVKNGEILDSPEIRSALIGLKFSNDSKHLYVSGGYNDTIFIYDISDHKLVKKGSIVLGKPWPKDTIGITGIDVDNARGRIYAVSKEDNSLYICDLKNKAIVKKFPLGAEAYTCLLSPDKKMLYISLWGGGKVTIFDTQKEKIVGEITTESHPNDMVITRNGKYLFVANANVNSVSVIDIAKRKVLENIVASLYPDAPSGTTPNGVALSTDNKTLFIANADNNDLLYLMFLIRAKANRKDLFPLVGIPLA